MPFAPRGTALQHSPDGVTYTTIAKVLKIDNTGSKADLADVTNMDSPTIYREFLPTLADAGEVTFDCNFEPGDASQQILNTDFQAQTEGYYKIVLPGSLGSATFRAYVSSQDFALPIDKQGTKALKLKVTGPITPTW
jgi:predicted secreted protein